MRFSLFILHHFRTEWNVWGQWGDCTETCGIGYQVRRRTCNEVNSGSSCQGSDTDSQRCIQQNCPGRMYKSVSSMYCMRFYNWRYITGQTVGVVERKDAVACRFSL